MLIQLVLLLVTFVTAIVAILSDTKNVEKKRLTRLGVVTLTLAVASSVANAYVTISQSIKQDAERVQRVALGKIACAAMHRSARRLSHSLFRLATLADPPSVFAPPSNRFDEATFERIAKLNAFSTVGFAETAPSLDTYVTDSSRHVRADISSLLGRYSSVLDPSVVTSAEALLSDRFFLYLCDLSPGVRAASSLMQRDNPRFPPHYWPLFFSSQWRSYQRFQGRLEAVSQNCLAVLSEPSAP